MKNTNRIANTLSRWRIRPGSRSFHGAHRITSCWCCYWCAITSSLALFLGFGDGNHSVEKSLRIGAFGLAAVIGALSGLYIRAHEVLSPSAKNIYDSYRALDFTEEEARSFVKFKKLGILDPDWRMAFAESSGDSTSNGASAATMTLSATSLLFSDEVSSQGCDYFIVDDNSTLATIKADFEQVNDKGWNNLLKNVLTLYMAENDQKIALKFLIAQICQNMSIDCSTVKSLNQTSTLAQFESTFNQAGEKWSAIFAASDVFEDGASRQKLLYLFLQTSCNEK